MRYLILSAAALALGAAPALAATTTNTPAGPGMTPSGITGQANNESANGTSGTQNQANMPSPEIRHRITQQLSQAGFTDIHIMPQSFLVHAKDSAGNPVFMTITPNSVVALTLTHSGAQSAGNSSNNPSGAMNGSNNAMGTQGSSGSWGAHHANSAMGSSTMQHSAQAGSAINSPNGNGTTVH